MKSFIRDDVSKHTNVFDVLKERGFIEQCTHEEEIRELLGNEKSSSTSDLTLPQTVCISVTLCRL